MIAISDELAQRLASPYRKVRDAACRELRTMLDGPDCPTLEIAGWSWHGALDRLKQYCPDGMTIWSHKGPGCPIPVYARARLTK